MPERTPQNEPVEVPDIPDELADAAPEPPGAEAADSAREGRETEEETATGDASEVSLEERAAADPRSREELLAELLEAEARRDEYLDDVRRARAEFENYRKRMMRDGVAQRSAGKAEVATRLLDVLDDFDRTVDAAETSEDESLRKGVELVYGKLIDVLRGIGLRRIDVTGVPFDPSLHEAVQQVAAEGDDAPAEPVVAEVLRPGYRLDDRVLRAAMVVVKQ